MDWSQVKSPGRELAREVISALVEAGFVEEPTDSRAVKAADTIAQLVRDRLPKPPHIIALPRRRAALLDRLEHVRQKLNSLSAQDTRRSHVDGERIALMAAIDCLDYVGRIR